MVPKVNKERISVAKRTDPLVERGLTPKLRQNGKNLCNYGKVQGLMGGKLKLDEHHLLG